MVQFTVSLSRWSYTWLMQDSTTEEDVPLDENEAREFLDIITSNYKRVLNQHNIPFPGPAQWAKLQSIVPLTVRFRRVYRQLPTLTVKPSELADIFARKVENVTLFDSCYYITFSYCPSGKDNQTAAQMLLDQKPAHWHPFPEAVLSKQTAHAASNIYAYYVGKAMVGSGPRTLGDCKSMVKTGTRWNRLVDGVRGHLGRGLKASELILNGPIQVAVKLNHCSPEPVESAFTLLTYEDKRPKVHSALPESSVNIDRSPATRLIVCRCDPDIAIYTESFILSLFPDSTLNLEFPMPLQVSSDGWLRDYAMSHALGEPSYTQCPIVVLGPARPNGDPLQIAYSYITILCNELGGSKCTPSFISTHRTVSAEEITQMHTELTFDDKDDHEDSDTDSDTDDEVTSGKQYARRFKLRDIDIASAINMLEDWMTVLVIHGVASREAFAIWAQKNATSLIHLHPSDRIHPSSQRAAGIVVMQWYQAEIRAVPRFILCVRNIRTNVHRPVPYLLEFVRACILECLVATECDPREPRTLMHRIASDRVLLSNRKAMDYGSLSMVQSNQVLQQSHGRYTNMDQFPALARELIQEQGVLSFQPDWVQYPIPVKTGQAEFRFRFFLDRLGFLPEVVDFQILHNSSFPRPRAVSFCPDFDATTGILRGKVVGHSTFMFGSDDQIWMVSNEQLSQSPWIGVLQEAAILPKIASIASGTPILIALESLDPRQVCSMLDSGFPWSVGAQKHLHRVPEEHHGRYQFTKNKIRLNLFTLPKESRRVTGYASAFMYHPGKKNIVSLHFGRDYEYLGWREFPEVISRLKNQDKKGDWTQMITELEGRGWKLPSHETLIHLHLGDEWDSDDRNISRIEVQDDGIPWGDDEDIGHGESNGIARGPGHVEGEEDDDDDDDDDDAALNGNLDAFRAVGWRGLRNLASRSDRPKTISHEAAVLLSGIHLGTDTNTDAIDAVRQAYIGMIGDNIDNDTD